MHLQCSITHNETYLFKKNPLTSSGFLVYHLSLQASLVMVLERAVVAQADTRANGFLPHD